MKNNIRNAWNNFENDFKYLVRDIFKDGSLRFTLPWNPEYKTISEVSPRLIEGYLLDQLMKRNDLTNTFVFERVKSRDIGDVKVSYNFEGNMFEFHIDFKSSFINYRKRTLEYYQKHNLPGKRPGPTHPNLISVKKLVEFNKDQNNKDIIIFMIDYDIIINGKDVVIDLTPALKFSKLFLLRDIHENNFNVGRLGKGQLQGTRLDDLEFRRRTKEEFIRIFQTYILN